MLIVKMVAVHASEMVTSPSFSLFGLLWFCLSDFIPRAAPTLAFIFLMSSKRPSKEIRSNASHKHRPDNDDYQFVQLPASDSRHEDGIQSLYFGGAHSNTELMLKSDFLVESPVHAVIQKSAMRASMPPGDLSPNSFHSMPPHGSTHLEAQSLRDLQQPEDDDSSSDSDNDRGFYSYEWKAAENKIVDRLFSMLYFKTALPSSVINDAGTGAAQSDSSDDILV